MAENCLIRRVDLKAVKSKFKNLVTEINILYFTL